MAIVGTGNFSKAMLPGVFSWFGIDYNEFQKFTPQMFDVVKSEKLYEEMVSAGGLGLMKQKDEGDGIQYDAIQQGYVTRVYNKTWALGLQYTEEVIEDNQYKADGLAILSKEAGRYLARAAGKTEETLAGNFYNNAFTALGGDGVAFLSASHPTVRGATYSNMPSVACDISELALEQANIDIKRLKDDAGTIIQLMAKSIIAPPEQEFEINRILKSTNQNDSANNAINALKNMGSFPGGVVINPYLSSAKAWFVRTDVMPEKGLVCFDRIASKVSDDNSFETGNAKFKCRFRRSFTVGDPRAWYGSQGN
jgi:hypothetical protein